MKEFWNDRYSNENYAYGTSPNVFFSTEIEKLESGRLLLPAEGEGRNGVFAAKLGWEVTAYDISEAGRDKALRLAKANNVSINYVVGTLDDIDLPESHFDAIGLIYAHWPPALRASIHRKLVTLLRPGGTVILEGFSQDHLKFNTINVKAGGPKDPDRLLLIERIANDFEELKIIHLDQQIIELNEGAYHQGKSDVIRFVGRK